MGSAFAVSFANVCNVGLSTPMKCGTITVTIITSQYYTEYIQFTMDTTLVFWIYVPLIIMDHYWGTHY